MKNTIAKILVGFLGFSLVVILSFSAYSKGSLVVFVQAVVALFATLKLLSIFNQRQSETAEGITASKRNFKLVVIGLTVGLVGPFLLILLITQIIR
jgi:hypothetical protein